MVKMKNRLNVLQLLFSLAVTVFFNTISIDLNQEHDANFRKFFCNNQYREALTELPAHLVDACKKSGIDSQNIHVFKENRGANYRAYTVGSNIMLINGFWKLDNETQAWYFAHELSHVKHGDTDRLWKLREYITDFQIGSSAVAILNVARLAAVKKMQSLPSIVTTAGIWGVANIVALRMYYKNIQVFELRANDEAAKAVGTDAAIKLLKEDLWRRNYGQNLTIAQRLHIYKELLGFCDHGSHELQLSRLEKLRDEQTK